MPYQFSRSYTLEAGHSDKNIRDLMRAILDEATNLDERIILYLKSYMEDGQTCTDLDYYSVKEALETLISALE